MSLGSAIRNLATQNRALRKYVGIVGGGPAGLYSAMLLQQKGYLVHIFEASNRVGGRIYTHRFNCEKNQYFEAGAMRIPENEYQKPFFELVKEINAHEKTDDQHHIKLIPYILETPQNRFYLNKFLKTYQDASISGSGDLRASDVHWPGFPPPPPGVLDPYNTPVSQLLHSVLDPLFKIIQEEGFENGFKKIVTLYDNFSFRFYLKSVHSWSDAAIDFVETAASQTNQFSLSVPELFMQNMDFGVKTWQTIADGMERLPQAMANIIGLENITFNAPVTQIQELNNEKIQVHASGADSSFEMYFDHVILAIPPAALRMIASRPRWGAEKELAIRSMHFEALWKMGMRFKTRFWETQASDPEQGGQSVTDLPIRWVVLPSYGIHDNGPGVLLLYAWMTDAQAWLPLSPSARRALAISCLEQAYPDVDVRELLIETFDVTWASESATGDAMFLPGQWESRFETARRAEKNIYFAGEHLSYHHTWITGALLSASYAVGQFTGPLQHANDAAEEPHSEISQGSAEAQVENVGHTTNVPLFKLTPKSPYGSGVPRTVFYSGHRSDAPPKRPQNLGADPNAPLIGPRVVHIPGPANY